MEIAMRVKKRRENARQEQQGKIFPDHSHAEYTRDATPFFSGIGNFHLLLGGYVGSLPGSLPAIARLDLKGHRHPCIRSKQKAYCHPERKRRIFRWLAGYSCCPECDTAP